MSFTPTITYTLPTGWGNYEDLAGNFLLIPPGSSLADVAGSTGDYIGIYGHVAADSPECNATPAAGVPVTAIAIARALSTRPGLTTTAPKAVTVGDRTGMVMDVRMTKGWTKAGCPVAIPNVPLLVGVAPSDFEDAVLGTLVIRLYILDDVDHVMAIEVDDIANGGHLAGYDLLVKALRFGPG